MTTFEIIALIGALCGVIMVVGGIVLLRVGAIKLSEVGKAGQFALQIRKDIKITTSYPALGIFVIGLLFIGVPLYSTKPDRDLPLSISGKVDVPDPSSVRVQVEPDQVTLNDYPDSYGRFDKTMHPGISRVKVTIVAAGYEPAKVERLLDVDRGRFGRQAVVRLPTDLTSKLRKVAAKPNVGEIQPVLNAKLPDVTSAPAF